MHDAALWLWNQKGTESVIPILVNTSLSDISVRKTCSYLRKNILWPEFTKGLMCLITDCVSFLALLPGNSELNL